MANPFTITITAETTDTDEDGNFDITASVDFSGAVRPRDVIYLLTTTLDNVLESCPDSALPAMADAIREALATRNPDLVMTHLGHEVQGRDTTTSAADEQGEEGQ